MVRYPVTDPGLSQGHREGRRGCAVYLWPRQSCKYLSGSSLSHVLCEKEDAVEWPRTQHLEPVLIPVL